MEPARRTLVRHGTALHEHAVVLNTRVASDNGYKALAQAEYSRLIGGDTVTAWRRCAGRYR